MKIVYRKLTTLTPRVCFVCRDTLPVFPDGPGDVVRWDIEDGTDLLVCCSCDKSFGGGDTDDAPQISLEEAIKKQEDGELMGAKTYQAQTASTAQYPGAGTGQLDALNYAVIGLVDEAGEVAGKWKKVLRGDTVEVTCNEHTRHLPPEVVRALQDECGDVLWYLARIAEETGTTLEKMMQRNADKLLDRKKRGVLKGNGDNR